MQVTIMGRLVRDAEMVETRSDTTIARFTIAANRNKRKQDGTWDEKTWYANGTAFGKVAEKLLSARRGSEVFAAGYIETQRWEDKASGKPRSKDVFIPERLWIVKPANAGDDENYNSEDGSYHSAPVF